MFGLGFRGMGSGLFLTFASRVSSGVAECMSGCR